MILTNDIDFIMKAWPKENIKFSDHKLVNCVIDMIREDKDNNDNDDIIEYLTKVPQYVWRSGMDDQWSKYHEILNENDWKSLLGENDTVEQKVKLLYQMIEDAVSLSFDNQIVKKKNRKKIPKEIKNLFWCPSMI